MPVTKLEVLPATSPTGCRPPFGAAGEHVIDYASSYPGIQEIGCHTKTPTGEVHHAVSVAMYRCRRCNVAMLAVSPADGDQPQALFEVFGAQGPDQ